MKYIKLAAFMGLTSSVWAQQEMPLAPFSKIEIEAPVKVQLISGKETKVSSAKSLDGLSFKVSKDVLRIEPNGENFKSNETIKLYFTQLNEMDLNGTSQVSMESGSTIKEESFDLDCNGATVAQLNVDVKKLKIEGNGATKINLKGKAENAELEITGASKLNSTDLNCQNLKLEASGASVFEVNAKESMQIDASGASKGVYSGNPTNKNINVSGISKVTDNQTGESMNDDRSGNDDTTRITVGKKKLIIIDKGDEVTVEKEDDFKNKDGIAKKSPKKYELKHVYSGFEMGVNQLISPNLNFALPANYNYLDCKMEKSWTYGLNLMEGDLQIIRNKLAITSGFGMDFQNFNFNSNQVLQANTNQVSADSGLVVLSKNKLYNYNLNVPLMLKFAPRTKKEKNNFHLAVGVIGTFKAYSHLRVESSASGFEQESKLKDDFNINPFRLTATVRVGYGWLRAFANYSLTPYFKSTNGNPDIRVFTAGLTLVPFN